MRTLTLPEFPSTPALQPALRRYVCGTARHTYAAMEDALLNPPSPNENKEFFRQYADRKRDSTRPYIQAPVYRATTNWKLHNARFTLDELSLFCELHAPDAAAPLQPFLDSHKILNTLEKRLGCARTA